MPEAAPKPAPQPQDPAAAAPQGEDFRVEVALAIEACGGDLRDTVVSLVVLSRFQRETIARLERKVARLEAVASVGYMRGKQPKPPEKI